MKIFITMNKLCAAVLMTVGMAMGTSAHADMVYDGDMFAHSLENGSYSDAFINDTFVDAYQDFINGRSDLSGDQNGFVLIFENYTSWDVVDFGLSLDMTFDTATEITISSGFWESGTNFYLYMPDDGTYTVDAGETFHFELSLITYQAMYEGHVDVSFAEVPAPGALALLGLAGISTRRRRR